MTAETTVFSAMLAKGCAPGQLVQSKAGHDQGRIYLILAVDGNFAACIDGDYRPVDRPKRKRVSHLRRLGALPPGWQEALQNLTDLGQQNALVRSLIHDHPGWNPAEVL